MSEPQKFVGTLIAKTALEIAIDKVLKRAAKSPNISLEQRDVAVIREAVKDEAEWELNARVEHVSNAEPFYQSRVSMGSILAVVSAGIAIAQMLTDNVPNTWEEYSPPIGVVAGGLYALYGRWIAKKPFGK